MQLVSGEITALTLIDLDRHERGGNMQPEDEWSDEFSEIEIVDLPDEDGAKRGEKARIVNLAAEDGDGGWDRLAEDERAPAVKRAGGSSIGGVWRRERRKINGAVMGVTILLALLLLNSAGGSLLVGKMMNTVVSRFGAQKKQGTQGKAQVVGEDTSNDLLTTLLRATPPGPAPTNCPAVPTIKSSQNSLVQHPLTIFGFRGPQAQMQLRVIQRVKSRQGELSAWGAQLILQIDARDPPSVWLHLSSLSGGRDPIFGYRLDGAQAAPAMSAANGTDTANIAPSPSTLYLNPLSPNENSVEVWSVGSDTWVTDVYFKDAGCYKLAVGWPDGRWDINFASGV
jgi:hypothetical protein